MVEMLGVLAIVGVLSVGGIAGYSQAMAKFKVTKAMDQVQTIITNMRTLYASSRTYSNVTPATAYTVGILTDETYTGSKGINPFGGEINFGNTTRTFSVTYTNLTPEACVKIATAEWGADESSGLVSMAVGKGKKTFRWASDSTKGTGGNLPVTVAKAIENCGSSSADGIITWEYR